MKKNKFLMFAAAAVMFASCGGGGARPQFGDNEYPVVTVGTSSTTMQSTYPATIKGVQDVEIHPKVQGFITQINVKEGQTVSAGQVLFVLDNLSGSGASGSGFGKYCKGSMQYVEAEF